MLLPSRSWLLSSLVVVVGLWSGPLAAQEAPPDPDLILLDTIEVGLVDLDFVVTDKKGDPVRGLTADDFELRVGRRPVEIEFFSETTAPPLGEGDEAERVEQLPYLVVLVDCQTLNAVQRGMLLEELRDQLPRLLDSSRSVMVASVTRRLRIDQPFTRDLDALEEVLRAVATYPTITNASDDRMVARSIERALDPAQVLGDDLLYQRAVDEGERLLSSIEIQATAQRTDSVVAATQIGDLLTALAGTRHRVSMLFYSGGLVSHPAELLYRQWWAKFSLIGPELGKFSVEQLLSDQDAYFQVPELVEQAAGSRVSIYAVTPGDEGNAQTSFADASTIEVGILYGGEGRRNLADLAQSTGGAASTFGVRAERLYQKLLADLGHYYSLAFDAREIAADDARIRLRPKTRGLEVRYFERYGRVTLERRLEQTALAALHLDTTTNPLEVGIELGKATPYEGKSWVLPMMITVPFSRLALLPNEKTHRGRLSMVVAARGENGSRSRPVLGTIPLEIENAELVEWLGRHAGYRLQLQVSAGVQKIAVAVRDDVGAEVSALNIEVEVGGD